MIETATGVPGDEPELARGVCGQTARALAHRTHARADPREALVGEIAEPDRAEEAVVPPACSWPRYVHLHTVVQSERTSLPVAR